MVLSTTEIMDLMRGYVDSDCLDEVKNIQFKDDKFIVLDLTKVMEFSPDLAEVILDDPVSSLKAYERVLREQGTLPDNFDIRIKNAQRYTNIPISKIRSKHISKLITVEGMVKQKSDVRAQITTALFECPMCGQKITILQLDDRKFSEPTYCACGRRSKFTLLGKNEVDMFSMLLEEPTELISGGTKLSQIKVLCRASLTDPEMERLLYQGVRAEVTGILSEIQIRGQGGQLTNKIDWFVDANYIKVHDESFVNIKWTKEDEEEFQKLSNQKDWLKQLRQSIFYDIHGYEEECEGIILQMFSGVGRTRDGAKVRGNFHILLVGDPGSSKSTMLKIAQRFAPKAMYVAGVGVSGVGLTASAVKDELLGGYTLDAGALVLCNNGLLCIDELDKVDDEHKKALHEPLADETISVSKSNVHATLVAQTSVLAAANPKHGSYSDYDSVYSQIDLAPTLINRFDLIYPIRESKLTTDDDYEIAMKILSRADKDEKKNYVYSREFIKKYIAYARTITPDMPKPIQEFIAEKYKKLKELKRRMNSEGRESLPVTGRNVDGMRRVIEAIARSRLHNACTMDDAELGYRKVIYSIQQIGIDPDSGELVAEWGVGKAMKNKDVAARIYSIIRDRTKGGRGLMDVHELYAILASEGLTDETKVDEIIGKLKNNGDIIEGKPNKYQVVFT